MLSEIPAIVRGDEKRLRQVLINLLGNAVKFTDAGGVTFKVGYVMETEEPGQGGFSSGFLSGDTLLSHPSGQSSITKMRFLIEDTGIGMPSEQIAEIFLPFHQIGDPTRQAEGTGLGLAISQKLVQLMGGKLHVESRLGQGSVFCLDLDLPRVSEEADVAEHHEGRVIRLKEKYRLLVVDDKWENRSVLVDLLTPLGFEVLEARNGQEGLNQALQHKPDVILLDMVMPGMDGFEAVKKLRELPNLDRVVVIAMSASAFDNDQEKSLTAGCDGFISKPVQVEKLLGQLGHHLGLEWVYEQTDVDTLTVPDGAIDPIALFPKVAIRDERNNPAHTGLPLPGSSLPATHYAHAWQTLTVAPPPEELQALYELAMMGDIRGIQQQAKRLEQLNEQFAPFAQQLSQLAKGFQEKQILEFVRKYLAENE
jgi:CheY-like chemotaxis protein